MSIFRRILWEYILKWNVILVVKMGIFANITMKKPKVVIIQMFVMFIKKIKRSIGGRNNRE